ncbi:MAG TPA: hydrogen gas-evolving membrane-bound hydrogenase subunit E [Ilumatobacter sp.]|nr:hydrogen gas-evolving membrane-bound hydrogenase subunit E [Ilumatobacter sp.]
MPGSLVGVLFVIVALLALHCVVGISAVALHHRLSRWAFAVAAVPAFVTLVSLATRLRAVLDGEPIVEEFSWVPQLGLSFVLRVDAFAALMVLLVSGIGLLVCVYAVGYFSHPKPGTGRLAGLLTLFAGAMLGVVVSDHLLAMFVFWELTTVTSYLLIGNDDWSPEARDAALMAILITGAGGLAMLAGLVIVGQAAGTYQISELATAAPLSGSAVTVGVICILIGAFTKSAQVPFSGWLPGAMVAPTPISAYLHAATMVKAGVFLMARLAPALADIGPWRPLVLGVGAATMVVGGWRALRQHDLKLLLAHGTVSQLGFLTMLVGAGAYDVAQAGAVLLLAHGAFKAALFMVVGIVDHQTGTRDVRRLHGFGRGWTPVMVVGVVAAASMAGLPPLLGFIAKEKALDAATGDEQFMLVAIVAGSILTVAYSGRFVLGLLGRLGEPDADVVSRDAPVPGWGLVAPSVVLTVFTVVAGLAPVIVDRFIRASTTSLYADSHPANVKLWAGFNTALVLSGCIIAAGAVLVWRHATVSAAQDRFHTAIAWVPSNDRAFWGAMSVLARSAKHVTATVQNGSLPLYLMVILAVAALAPLGPAVSELDTWPAIVGDVPVHIPLAAVIAAGAIGAAVVRRRIAAALLLGAVGYAMAGFYVVQGAPDLALTQFAIETLATVLFVLVLRFLPRQFEAGRAAVTVPIRLAVSVAVGVSVFVLALVASAARRDVSQDQISGEMLARSVPDGKGANVVNVILVDFRGLDTMGEITVLVIAALGAVALARATRGSAPVENDHAGFARLPVVVASSRVLFPSIVVLSLYFLFAGHNQPGGGFVGGLTAGAAISLRYVAGGVTSVRESFRFKPWTILGGGMVLSIGTALVPLLSGRSLLEHSSIERDVVVLGTVKATTALPFDVGVYLVVIGLVLMAFEAFGDDVAPDSGSGSVGSAAP